MARITVALMALVFWGMAAADSRPLADTGERSESWIVRFAATETGTAPLGTGARRAWLAQRAERLGRSRARLLTQLATLGIESQRHYRHLPLVVVAGLDAQRRERLKRFDGVEGVYPNRRREALLEESLPLIGQPAVAAGGNDGAGTAVAVIDTGVDYTREAFGCSAVGEPAACPVVAAVDFAPDDGALDEEPYHGTNVAGIVAGVAPGADILALDVFSGQGAWDDDILAAIDWVVENQARYDTVAMNLSLGGYGDLIPCDTSPYTAAFEAAWEVGVVPVVAAGNEGLKEGLAEPACVPSAVSVGAVYDADLGRRDYGTTCQDRAVADEVVCFSNSSEWLTLLAPGASIDAAGVEMDGTSQATPHVAGAIAVLQGAYAQEPALSAVQRLVTSGKPIEDPVNGIVKPRIDLGAAMDVPQPPETYDYAVQWRSAERICFSTFLGDYCLVYGEVELANAGPAMGSPLRDLELYLSRDAEFDDRDLRIRSIALAPLNPDTEAVLPVWAFMPNSYFGRNRYVVARFVGSDADATNDTATTGPLR